MTSDATPAGMTRRLGAGPIDPAALTARRIRDPTPSSGPGWPAAPPRDLLTAVSSSSLLTHPARGALSVRGNPRAMSSRVDLLDRLAMAISRPGVDGVLGTPTSSRTCSSLGCWMTA